MSRETGANLVQQQRRRGATLFRGNLRLNHAKQTCEPRIFVIEPRREGRGMTQPMLLRVVFEQTHGDIQVDQIAGIVDFPDRASPCRHDCERLQSGTVRRQTPLLVETSYARNSAAVKDDHMFGWS
jgi:hypothetical protein